MLEYRTVDLVKLLIFYKENKTVNVADVLFEAEKLLTSDLPVSQLNLFLRIPDNGTVPVTMLKKFSTLTGAGVSRSLAILAGFHVRNRSKFPRYIEILLDESDRRYKLVRLTEKGRDLKLKLLGTHA